MNNVDADVAQYNAMTPEQIQARLDRMNGVTTEPAIPPIIQVIRDRAARAEIARELLSLTLGVEAENLSDDEAIQFARQVNEGPPPLTPAELEDLAQNAEHVNALVEKQDADFTRPTSDGFVAEIGGSR